MASNRVYTSKGCFKKLKNLPKVIREAVWVWIDSVEKKGVEQVRREKKGYRDKVLQGKRRGQRSIRLNKDYRLFYSMDKNGEINILEINKHEY